MNVPVTTPSEVQPLLGCWWTFAKPAQYVPLAGSPNHAACVPSNADGSVAPDGTSLSRPAMSGLTVTSSGWSWTFQSPVASQPLSPSSKPVPKVAP